MMSSRSFLQRLSWFIGCLSLFAPIFPVATRGSRVLAGDFQELNDIVETAQISLPDMQLSRRGMRLKLTSIVCTDFGIRDARLSSRAVDSRTVQVGVDLTDVDTRCRARYRYNGIIFSGSGDVSVASRGNDVSVGGYVTTDPPWALETAPPVNIQVNSCNPSVNINDIDFDGGVLGVVLNTVERLLRSIMERLLQDRLCSEVQETMTSAEGFLDYAKEILNKYGVNENTDPLEIEKNLSIPSSTDLLNLQDRETTFGVWIDEVLGQTINYLQTIIVDPITGRTDLQANMLIREFLLQDRALSLSADELPSNGVLYQGHDVLTETEIRMDKVKLLGLDTLIQVDPLNTVGQYTVQNRLALQFLAFEIDATIDIRPSTLSDSIIDSPSDTRIQEQVRVVLGINDLVVDVSLLSAIHQDLLESIQLGSLLRKENILSCLFATIFQMEVSTFSVQASDILTPYLDGFVSEGLDRIFSEVMDATFLLYERILLNRSPSFFQEEVRPLLNQRFLQDYISEAACPPVDFDFKGLVDFRDLFLPVDMAVTSGATGNEPYGNLFSSYVVPNLQAQVSDIDDFNERIVGSMTKQQSGKEGTLSFPSAVFEYASTEPSTLYDQLHVRVSNLKVRNLDTVVGPLNVLEPRDWNLLFNTISLESADPSKYLNVSVEVLLSIGGQASPLKMKNQVEVSVAIPRTVVSLGILASLRENALMTFPLTDATNPYCWISALGDMDLGDGKIAISSQRQTWSQPLDLSSVSFFMSSFSVDAKCVACSSPGAYALSDILNDVEQAGFAFNYRQPIIDVIEDLAWDLWHNFEKGQLLSDAPKFCPHSDRYDPNALQIPYSLPEISGLSKESTETVLAIGAIGLQTSLMVASKNQLLLNESDTENTVESDQIVFPANTEIINWTTLSEDFGGWAQLAFEEVQTYLQNPVRDNIELFAPSEEVMLQSNQLLKDYVLDEDGAYRVNITDMKMGMVGMEASLEQVRVYGLDSISSLEVFKPTSRQVLSNKMELDGLRVEVDLRVLVDGENHLLTTTYSTQSVVGEIDFLLAMDLTELGNVRMGSIFDTDRVLFCLMTGIEAVNLERLSLAFDVLDNPSFQGYFSSENQDSLDWVTESLFERYRGEIIEAMPGIFDTTIRNGLNALIPDAVKSLASQCIPPVEFPENGLVDFRDLLLSESKSTLLGGSGSSPYGDLFRTLYTLLEEKILQTGASNRPLINNIFRSITEKYSNTTGSLLIEGSVLDGDVCVKVAGLEAELGFSLQNVAFENIDSVGDPLELFRPVQGEPFALSNTLSFGVDQKPLTLKGVVVLTASDEAELDMRNEMEVVLSIENFILTADVLLKIAQNAFAQFPIRDLKNINCWLSTILSQSSEEGSPRLRGIGLLENAFSIGNFSFNVECISCTSPHFDTLLKSLYQPDNTTDLETKIIDTSEHFLDADFLPELLDKVVENAERQCPHHPNYDPEATLATLFQSPQGSMGLADMFVGPETKTMYYNIANSIFAATIFIFGVLCWFCVKRRNSQWIKSLSREGGFFFRRQQDKEASMMALLDASGSLFRSPHIPRRVRFGVPLAILLNIGLYMGGHLGTLSIVNIDASIAGEPFTVYEFLTFTFIGSTKATYDNGGAEMAVLVWIFTGIWPYVKLILSLFLWMLPTERLSVARRGRILLWIDALAKLSVIDIFTMLLGFAVLLVFIGGPDESLMNEDALYTTKAIVVPGAGFYCILVAQRMSRVSSRFFLEYHDKVVSIITKSEDQKLAEQPCSPTSDISASNSLDSNDLETSSLIKDPASPGSNPVPASNEDEEMSSIARTEEEASSTDKDESASSSETASYQWGTIGVAFGGVFILIIFIIGCIFAPAISLDATSVAGLAVESDKTFAQVVSEYGVFLVISGVLVKARFVLDTKADYVGFGLLLFAGVFSIGVVFFIQLYQWIKRKLKERKQRREQSDAEFPSGKAYGHKGCGLPFYLRLYKWRHMEIYLISVAIGVWQLGSITSYAIHMYCDILRQCYSVMTVIGLVEESSAECYRVQAKLPGNLVIVIGSFAILLLSFIFQARNQHKKNIADSLRWIDGGDIPSLSLVWSKDRSKNSRYSHLTSSLTLDEFFDEIPEPGSPLRIVAPGTPNTRASTPPGTPHSLSFQLASIRESPQFPEGSDTESSSQHRQEMLSAIQSPVLETPPRVVRSYPDELRHQPETSSQLGSLYTPPSCSGNLALARRSTPVDGSSVESIHRGGGTTSIRTCSSPPQPTRLFEDEIPSTPSPSRQSKPMTTAPNMIQYAMPGDGSHSQYSGSSSTSRQ